MADTIVVRGPLPPVEPVDRIEAGRLARAFDLKNVERMGPNEYAVPSRSREGLVWHVKLDLDLICECEDAKFTGGRKGPCIHEIIARLQRAIETEDWSDKVLGSAMAMLWRRQQVRSEPVSGVLRNAQGEAITGGAVKMMDVQGREYE